VDYTVGIFQTQDELQARRVLGHYAKEYAARFTYHDGWFSVLIPSRFAECAAYLNEIAIAVAHTDIKPQGLQAFKEVA
jgi:hypothetical protein